MATTPIRRPPRVRKARGGRLQQRIKEIILERDLSAGDPMPTELDLMEELDVSRNSLREALQALQAVGIVEIRHGYGMYVGRMSLGALVDELTFHGRLSRRAGADDLAHLVEIREALEQGLVDMTVGRTTDEDIARLGEAAARMEAEAEAGLLSPDTDRLFHDQLYRPVGNPLVHVLLSAFWDAYNDLQGDLMPAEEGPSEVAARHRRIYDAVAARDRSAARAALREHFGGIRKRLSLVDIHTLGHG